MTDWHVALTEAWDELARTTSVFRQYRTRLLTDAIPLQIDAAMRASDDAPCLMLRAAMLPGALFESGGMRLDTVPDQGGPLLILSLEDRSRIDFFTTICADLVASAGTAGEDKAKGLFLARLDAWRQFLRDRRDGLSRSETVGLIGELLVLERLLSGDSRCLDTWKAPTDGLHDFQMHGYALEVKTGIGPAPSITISRLDQLDTAGLQRLDLLHVRLIETTGGRALNDIISDVAGRLPDEFHRRAFENALLRRGLLPDDQAARGTPRVQLRAIDTYVVTDGFPKISRSRLPPAITEASYVIDVRGIAAFSTDVTASLEAFHRAGAG